MKTDAAPDETSIPLQYLAKTPRLRVGRQTGFLASSLFYLILSVIEALGIKGNSTSQGYSGKLLAWCPRRLTGAITFLKDLKIFRRYSDREWIIIIHGRRDRCDRRAVAETPPRPPNNSVTAPRGPPITELWGGPVGAAIARPASGGFCHSYHSASHHTIMPPPHNDPMSEPPRLRPRPRICASHI